MEVSVQRSLLMLIIMNSFVLSAASEPAQSFIVQKLENPEFHENQLFRAWENYYSPRIQLLRERYDLDSIVADEQDEWRRILLLRHWIKSNIAINNDNPTTTRGDAFAILDAAINGGGFHCAHTGCGHASRRGDLSCLDRLPESLDGYSGSLLRGSRSGPLERQGFRRRRICAPQLRVFPQHPACRPGKDGQGDTSESLKPF